MTELDPPYERGWGLLILTALELSLASHLVHEQGLSDLIGSMLRLGLFILVIESVLAKVSQSAARFFGKTGRFYSTLTSLNLSLSPLLLYLPLTLVCWAMGQSGWRGCFFAGLALEGAPELQ